MQVICKTNAGKAQRIFAKRCAEQGRRGEMAGGVAFSAFGLCLDCERACNA